MSNKKNHGKTDDEARKIIRLLKPQLADHKADRHSSQKDRHKNHKLKCDICGKVHR